MRKFGKRYYNRLNNRPIHTMRAKALAELIRRNGYNARVIPASQGSHRGSRIFFKKKDDGFFEQPDSPFQNTLSSGRQVRAGIKPKIPTVMENKRKEMVNSLTEGVAEGRTWEIEYLEYIDPFETDAKAKFGTNDLYQLESMVKSGEITEDDIRELFESYTTEELESLIGQTQNYASSKNTEEYVQNIYSPLVEMALAYDDPGKYAGTPKPKPITSEEFLDLALQSANWRASKFKEFSDNQKQQGRFGELKNENIEYFANDDLDLREYFAEGNSLLIPMKAIFITDGTGERKLYRMKFNTSEAYSMLESFRRGEGQLRDQELLKLELEFFQRMGGSVSDIDADLNVFYPSDSEDYFTRFTFLDYANQQNDMEDDYFYNLQMDIPYAIQQSEGSFYEVKNVYGVIGPGKKDYYDPELKGYFEPGPGDAGVFDRMPNYLKYYHDPEYRTPLDVNDVGEFGIDAIDNPFTGEREFDPYWERDGAGWIEGNDGMPLYDREVREWPLQGTQSVLWREHIVLDNPYGLYTDRTVQALRALYPTGTSRAIGIQDIIQKIKSDGWSYDPMIILAYLTGNGVKQITRDEFAALRDYDVISKYGDPNNIYGAINQALEKDVDPAEWLAMKNATPGSANGVPQGSITDMDIPQTWWFVEDMKNMATWDDIFD